MEFHKYQYDPVLACSVRTANHLRAGPSNVGAEERGAAKRIVGLTTNWPTAGPLYSSTSSAELAAVEFTRLWPGLGLKGFIRAETSVRLFCLQFPTRAARQ